MADIRRLEKQCKALANRRRLMILSALKEHGALTVSDIARSLGISLKATSKHLRILAQAGILEGSQNGFSVDYTLDATQEEPVKTVLRML